MKAGDRVQLSPGTDRWMMGDRFGVLVKQVKGLWLVKLDVSGYSLHFPRDCFSATEFEPGEMVEIVATGEKARIMEYAAPLVLIRPVCGSGKFWIERTALMLK